MRATICQLVGVSLFTVLTVLWPGHGFANGQHDHDKKTSMSDHMQAMYALKDQIPEEYRIMERTPMTPDQESLQRGGKLYRQQCRACHGQEGSGDGPAAQGLPTKPANFLDREHSAIYGPGEKYWIIGNGSGETGMPAFPQISPEDRWHLVNYIYDLQDSAEKHKGHDHSH